MTSPNAQVFAEIALQLEHATPDLTIETVIEQVSSCVPNDGAGLLLTRGRKAELSASSNELAAAADRLQLEVGEGPALEVLYRPESFTVEDLDEDTRWTPWRDLVRPLGIRSVLSVRLSTLGELVGALDLYSRSPRAFDEDDASVAAIFADHAAVAITAASTQMGLKRAIDARHVIGQAQGMLMERFDIGAEQAFAVLRRYSQHQNVRLRTVAERLVEARALPGEPAPDRGAPTA